jgi:hypothetical protein
VAYTSYGSFVGRKHSNDNTTSISTDNWKNIYVISSQRLYALASPANNTLYAVNEGQTGEDVVAGLYKYATVSDWSKASHDYTLFENDCWKMDGGVPVWKD